LPLGAIVVCDERAGAMPQLDQAGVLHLAIRFRDRIRVHYEILGELADPGQLIAGAQRAELNGVPHLLDELQVDRYAGLGIRLEHRLQYYAYSTVAVQLASTPVGSHTAARIATARIDVSIGFDQYRDPGSASSYSDLGKVAVMNIPTTPPPSAEVLAVLSRRLRTALALYESGVATKRAQLRRMDRSATEEDIGRRLADWLRTRPGAPFGDAEGIGRAGADSR
jgi:hypothetical protein